MSQLLNQLSEKTKVAFCTESRGDGNNNTLGALIITLNINSTDDLRTVLNRLQHNYPATTWSIQTGSVLISSTDIKDDPLDLMVKPFSFEGTVNEYVRFLNSSVTGLMAETVEIAGMYDRRAVYKIQITSQIRVKEALSLLTRDHGVRWAATIRDEGQLLRIPGGPGGKDLESRTGRVTLIFSRGPLPQLVK